MIDERFTSRTASETHEYENGEEQTKLGNAESFFQDDLCIKFQSLEVIEDVSRETRSHLVREVFDPGLKFAMLIF